MNRWQKRAAGKRKSTAFRPTRNEIQSAVETYLKNGGQITKLEANDENYKDFMNQKDSYSSITDFFFDN